MTSNTLGDYLVFKRKRNKLVKKIEVLTDRCRSEQVLVILLEITHATEDGKQ